MTDDQLTELNRKIAVMEASKTQKIESRNRDGTAQWTYTKGRVMKWDWDNCDYRVKPVEPRRVWVNVFGCGAGTAWSNELEAIAHVTPTSETVEFIELTPSVREKLGL